jgi:hypothetical protein
LTSAAPARDVFVSNVLGNDQMDGMLEFPTSDNSGPVFSLSRALRIARRGDRIIMHNTGEPYHDSVTLMGARHSGTAKTPFEIYGNGATIDGSIPVPEGAWDYVGDRTYRYTPPRRTYLLLFFNEKPLVERRLGGGEVSVPKLKPLEWCYFQGQAYFRPEDNKTPHQYQLTQTGYTVGITLYRVRNVVIDGLTIQGFQLDGVNAHDNVDGTRLAGLTCRGNGRSGISVGGVSDVVIERCLVGNNGRAQVRIEAPAKVNVVESEVLSNTAPAFEVTGQLFINGERVSDQ